MRGAESEKNMQMVFDATDFLGDSVEGFDTSAEVSVEVIAPLGLDPGVTIFCAEDYVVMKA